MKNKKTWLILSAMCVILGIIILTAGRILGGLPGFYIDRNGIHTVNEAQASEFVRDSRVLEAFESIEIDIDEADVELIESDRFAIDYCIAGEYGNVICEVKDGKLVFKEAAHNRIWNFGAFIPGFGEVLDETDCYIRIEVPAGTQFDDILINMEEGSLNLPSLYAEQLKLDNEYGDINIKKYHGEKLKVDMQDGDFSADVIEAEQAEFNNEYGNILIDRISGGNILSKLEDGEFCINSLDMDRTEVSNEYGNVCLGIAEDMNEYGLDLETEYGSINIADGKLERRYSDEGMTYRTKDSRSKRIEVSCEDGNIEVFQAR